MKKLLNTAFIYALAAMAGGVFYREFTKFNGFSGRTALGLYTRTCSCWERCFSCLPRCFPKSLTGPGKETSGCSTGCTIPGFA